MTSSREIVAHEQQHVTTLYERLDHLRAHTRRELARTRKAGPTGSPQNRSERDAFAALYEDRLAQLEAVEERLCFGRLDLDPGEDSPTIQTRYVGRIGLSDPDHTPILTDWRAPAARPFYQATAANRQGVILRRHLLTRGRAVVDVEDDVLDLDSLSTDQREHLAGEGALLAALNATRSEHMGDIVATIQAEQDSIIRDDYPGALVVQGGPGTGKTAVALHRVAYLLYAHRKRLEKTGVLIIGPNARFLRYIDRVLPSLGETGAVLNTLEELIPQVRATGTEPDAVAEIKGRRLWRSVLRKAVRLRQRLPQTDTEFLIGNHTLVLRPAMVKEAREVARRTRRPHNQARITFVRSVLAKLTDQYVTGLGYDVDPAERAEITEEIRQTKAVRVAINLAWMPVTPQHLLSDLLYFPDHLAAAAPMLSQSERDNLWRLRQSAWTAADIPLLDELAELVGDNNEIAQAHTAAAQTQRARDIDYAKQVLDATGNSTVSAETLAERFADTGPAMTTAERAALDRTWAYGHVVVDEAQELSAMAWRMVLRRVPSRSMTILGDIAQTSATAGTTSWRATLDRVLRDSWKAVELTVNYRTPATIMDVAVAVAHNAGLDIAPLTSVREGTYPIHVSRSDSLTGTQLRTEILRITRLAGNGTCAIILPDAARNAVGQAVQELMDDDAVGPAARRSRLTVLTAAEAKGLEFDTVLLLEPQLFLSQPRGESDLYVAMTRPTQALYVLSVGDLPDGFPPQHASHMSET